ncbi:unnamed protein product [marine sediment metagenome]|uniref:Uncharacterized protein n=1 Tax=marine sediment metagenome TaxID=412755 RepID=X1PWI1_9ZZZZ
MTKFILESHCTELPNEGEEIIIVYSNKTFEKAVYQDSQYMDKQTKLSFTPPKWWVRIVELDKH